MPEVLDIWQCIGCGRIEEVPQTCIGVCRTVKRPMVDSADYQALQAQAEAYAAVLRLIAGSTPRAATCLEHWRALQAQARAVLDGTAVAGVTARQR